MCEGVCQYMHACACEHINIYTPDNLGLHHIALLLALLSPPVHVRTELINLI